MTPPILYVGMDVHKDFVVITVFQGRRQEPLLLERGRGQIRSCYEASGAGYVLQRWMSTWGCACERSRLPKRATVTVGTCCCRAPGAIVTGPRWAPR
jgi:hypothetical protein